MSHPTNDDSATDEGDESKSVALIAMFTQIGDRWGLSPEERATLLDISVDALRQWQAGHIPAVLPPDQRERIAHVIGIDVGTHVFYGLLSPNAASHVRRLHTSPDGNSTALEVMLTGGTAGIAAVRWHLWQMCQ